MVDFLLEIGVEELPSSYIDIGTESLKSSFKSFLSEKGINVSRLEAYGTPRRLALLIYDLPERTPFEEKIIKGPSKDIAFDKEGKPTKALESFLSRNKASLKDLVEIKAKKGVYVGIKRKTGGESLKELLSNFSRDAIYRIPFPKKMRWKGSFSFGRPIRWIVCLFGSEPINIEIDGIRSGCLSKGHRILGSRSVRITEVKRYPFIMRENHVEPDKAKREKLILDFLRSLEGKGLIWVEDYDLLGEVANLVEYPFPILSSFKEEFLNLPEEVIINVLKVHQRFFSLKDRNGKISRFFVGVSNNMPRGGEISEGYERVVSARLNDALFFLEEDKKIPFDDRRSNSLKSISFHRKLGSMYDKTMRLIPLSLYISEKLSLGDRSSVERAAYLSKMDLTTHMVYEYPELQGVMGREYAKAFGEDERVYLALYEQYLPRFSGDELPRTDEGTVLSLADKIDNLAGFFGIGEEPTSSADPHGLRRAALGIVLIIIGKKLSFDITDVIRKSLDFYKNVKFTRSKDEIVKSLKDFIKTRMENYYLTVMNYSKDAVNAVFSLDFDNLLSYHLRMVALGEERKKSDFMDVFLPFKRVVNITKDFHGFDVDPSLFEREEEKRLFDKVKEVEGRFKELYRENDFSSILGLFRELKPYVDSFFDNVFVMVEDERVRNNRLSLLKRISYMFEKVADFSKFYL